MGTPQLCERMNFKDLYKYIDLEGWGFQQKIDGEHLVIHVDEGVVTYSNRKGEMIPRPRGLDMSMLDKMDGRWAFDGEYLDRHFFCFDLPLAPVGGWEEQGYLARVNVLNGLVEQGVFPAQFTVLPLHVEGGAKLLLMKQCVAINAEGIVAKKLDAPYRFGVRSYNTLKAKLWTSADVVISEVGVEGKLSVALQVYHQGQPLDVGSCKVKDEHFMATLSVGQVIEVKYLYATQKHKLYQPSFLKIRTDKGPEECTLDQLKPVNKQVLP